MQTYPISKDLLDLVIRKVSARLADEVLDEEERLVWEDSYWDDLREKVFDPGEQRFNDLLLTLFRAMGRDILGRMVEKGAGGGVRKDKPTKAEIESWLFSRKDWEKIFADRGGELIEGLVITAGERSMKEVPVVGVGFDVHNPEMQARLRSRSIKFAREVVGTTEEHIRSLLAEGMDAGEDMRQLRKRISDYFEGDPIPKRAEMIARTETLWASNAGTLEGYKQSGVVESKEWLVAKDERTCPFCVSVGKRFGEGQGIALEETFAKLGDTLTGYDPELEKDVSMTLKYEDVLHPPLHPRCRCTIVAKLKEVELEEPAKPTSQPGQVPADVTQEPVPKPQQPSGQVPTDVAAEPIPGQQPGRLPVGPAGVLQTEPAVTEEPKPKKEKKVSLTLRQRAALRFANTWGKFNPGEVENLAKTYGFTPEQVKQISKRISESTELRMDRVFSPNSTSFGRVMATGELENQFTVAARGLRATSSGALAPYKGGARDDWERTLTGGALQKNKDYVTLEENKKFPLKVAQERPVYGYLYDPLAQDRGHTHYGGVSLVMKPEVRGRTTLTPTNSSAFGPDNIKQNIATLENNAPMMRRFFELQGKNIQYYGEGVRREVLDMIEGKRYVEGFTRGGYTEAQIYGGVKLKRDVEKIIVDGSRTEYLHIQELGDKWGIKVEFKK